MKNLLFVVSTLLIALHLQASAPARPTHTRQAQFFVFDPSKIVSFTAAQPVVVQPAVQTLPNEFDGLVVDITSSTAKVAAEPLISPAKTKSFAATHTPSVTPQAAFLPGINAHKSMLKSRSCGSLKQTGHLKAAEEKQKSEKQTFVSPYGTPNPTFKKWEPKPHATKQKDSFAQHYRDGKSVTIAVSLAKLRNHIATHGSFAIKPGLLKKEIDDLEALAREAGVIQKFCYPCQSAKNLAAYAYDIGRALNLKDIPFTRVGKIQVLLDAISCRA